MMRAIDVFSTLQEIKYFIDMIQFRGAWQKINTLYNFTVESIDDGGGTIGISPGLPEVQLDHLFSWD